MKEDRKISILAGSVYITAAGIILMIFSEVLQGFTGIYRWLGVSVSNASIQNLYYYSFIFYLVGAEGFLYFISHRSKFDRVFKNLDIGIDSKIYPILKSKSKTKYSTTYKFTLPAGICVDDIIKHQEAIEQHIGKKINIEYINKGLFIVEEFHQNTQQFYDYDPLELKGNVPIMVGKDRKGNMITFDLAEGTEPHLLVAGCAGCGKSTALLAMITNLILTTNVNLHLIDLKHGAFYYSFEYH